MNFFDELTDDFRVFTYKVAYDAGTAPNPFHGLCTLAICKPAIRRVAKAGDIIVGLGCGDSGNRIVYCMRVSRKVLWEKYISGCYSDEFPRNKIPKHERDQGDCIWRQTISLHKPLDSWSHHENCDFQRDIKDGLNVLIAHEFWYFGKGDKFDLRLPKELFQMIPGRGHKSNANEHYKEQFIAHLKEALSRHNIKTFGIYGSPALSPFEADEKSCSSCRTKERESDSAQEDQ